MQDPRGIRTPEIERSEIHCFETRIVDAMIGNPHKTLLKGVLATDVYLDRPFSKDLPLDPGDAIAGRLIHMCNTRRIYRKSAVRDFITGRLCQPAKARQKARKKQ